MRRLLLIILLASCQRPALIGANGVLRVTQSRVDFGERWLGSTTALRLSLANTGRAALEATFETTTPFEVAPSLTLGGGESADLQLRFTPTTLGASEAQLELRVDGAQYLVTLVGTGVDPPPCDSTVCRDATLDPVTAQCLLSPKPDGADCSDACLESAHCNAGACLGEPKSCGDGNRCTVDACDSSSGCTHVPLSCPASSPCMRGSCDPLQGCTESPVSDGTACGDADCTSANVCIQGQCVVRPVPDGAACGRASLCQQEGRCAAQVCVLPPATTLTKQWTFEVTPGRWLIGLVADDAGSVFTVECTNAGTFRAQCGMVSLSSTGALRFRTPFPFITNTGAGGPWPGELMVAGDLVISAVETSRLIAIDRASGTVAWTVDTRTLGLFPPATTTVRPVALAFDGVRTVIATLEATNFGSINGNALIGLELSTGALVHSVPLPAQGVAVVLDRASNLYLDHSIGVGTWTDTITSFDPSWTVRWQRTTPPANSQIRVLSATHGDRLLWEHPLAAELATTINGATIALPTPSGITRGTVWSDDALFVLHQFCPTATCSGFFDFRLEVDVFPSNGATPLEAPLPPLYWFTPLWLTDTGTALVTFRDRTGPAILRELDASGVTGMDCPLGLETSRNPRANPVFSAGRYVILSGRDSDGYDPRIDAWGLPGYSPATKGWVSERGGPEQDLRAR